MKTPVTILVEILRKMGHFPKYEFISKTGPDHKPTFEYKCVADEMFVTATGLSKKEALQECARRMLLILHTKGHPIPPPYDSPRFDDLNEKAMPKPIKGELTPGGPSAGLAITSVSFGISYVSMLKELSERYRLGQVDYKITDEGTSKMPRFNAQVQVGEHIRVATAPSKKEARQIGAELLYRDLCRACNCEETGPNLIDEPFSSSYMFLLKELGERNRMGRVKYTMTKTSLPGEVPPQYLAKAHLGGYFCDGVGGTKKAARQRAAENLYYYLRNVKVNKKEAEPNPGVPKKNYLSLLNEISDRYRLGAAKYTVILETLPSQPPHFSAVVHLGGHIGEGEGGSKKQARHRAARQLCEYLYANNIIQDDLKAPTMWVETSDTKLSLELNVDTEKRQAALVALSSNEGSEEERLSRALEAMSLRLEDSVLGPRMVLLSIVPLYPPLVYAGPDLATAHQSAIGHLRLALDNNQQKK